MANARVYGINMTSVIRRNTVAKSQAIVTLSLGFMTAKIEEIADRLPALLWCTKDERRATCSFWTNVKVSRSMLGTSTWIAASLER